MLERAIPTTRNEHVNAKMIEQIPGEEKVYFSHDTTDDDTSNTYPLDFLNSVTPNGLPPHELRIKKNCPVILLRNLDPQMVFAMALAWLLGVLVIVQLILRLLMDNMQASGFFFQ
jgi:hypothetical protein